MLLGINSPTERAALNAFGHVKLLPSLLSSQAFIHNLVPWSWDQSKLAEYSHAS